MSALQDKIRRLERYLADDQPVDRVVEQTVDKLIEREKIRLSELKVRLDQQLTQFEKQYALPSSEFYTRFERGEMGDATDFVEWSATYEMVSNLAKRLAMLQESTAR